MRFDKLYVWFLADPLQPKLVGALQLVQSGGKGVSLTYAPDWMEQGFPLSEDLPLSSQEYLPPGRIAAGEPVAVGAIDDARPDRWGERVIRFVDKPARLSLMEFLFYAGDDRFGALGVSTSDSAYLPRAGGPLPRLEQVQEMSQVAEKIAAAEPITEIERQIIRSGGSLGGAKPKALVEINGEQWVVKFASGEPIDVPLVEHATMTLAAKAGIRVAETRALPLVGQTALAVRRFDRTHARRIHCLSAGTALRAIGERDFGYPALALLLRRAGSPQHREADAQEIFRRMVFNILMDNTDDHEKNHALQVTANQAGGSMRLSPAFDVLPTNSGQGMQEFVCGTDGRDSTLANAMSQPQAFGLDWLQAGALVHEVIEVVDTWRSHFESCGVTPGDLEQLAERIDGDELLEQRRSFRAEDHGPGPAKRRRPGPFGPPA